MQHLSDSEWDDSHSLNYVTDGWSICVLANGSHAGRTTWRIHGKREGIQFHATGSTLAEAWKNAAFQALDRLLEERNALHGSIA
jgi:hypothetical protein